MLQTTASYGNPPESGAVYNRNKFDSSLGKCDCNLCMRALFFMPCEVAEIAQKGVGMPWWMAFCLLNPCSVRNLVRYQYRIQGNDLMEELCAPCSYYGGTTCLTCCFAFLFCPCVSLALCPTYVGFLNQLRAEVDTKGSGEKERYLLGFHSPQPLVVPSRSSDPKSIEYSVPGHVSGDENTLHQNLLRDSQL